MTAHLSAIRAAHRNRIDDAALRDQERVQPVGMPNRLFDASCWLISQGLADDTPCDGERYFAMPISRVRRFLDGCTRAEVNTTIEAGRKAIFEGSRCRPAICPAVGEGRLAA